MTNFESQYYESDHWWKEGMVEDAANLQRMQRTIELIPADATWLLDVGCGNGVFARMVKSRRPELHISCTDRSATALQYVSADEVVQSEITALPFADKSFDCVTCLEVIEHLTQPDFPTALRELSRVSKQYVIISVPFNEAIEKNMSICPACHTCFNSDLHLRKFSLAYFKEVLRENGFFLTTHLHPVPQSHYLGFRSYFALRRWLAGESGKPRFASICPICGMRPPVAVSTQTSPAKSTSAVHHLPNNVVARAKPAFSGRLKRLIKTAWPKQSSAGYWIVGLFSRQN